MQIALLYSLEISPASTYQSYDETKYAKKKKKRKKNYCLHFLLQIFGFLNFFLWTVNLWFLYKETSWFQQDAAAAGAGGQSPI